VIGDGWQDFPNTKIIYHVRKIFAEFAHSFAKKTGINIFKLVHKRWHDKSVYKWTPKKQDIVEKEWKDWPDNSRSLISQIHIIWIIDSEMNLRLYQ